MVSVVVVVVPQNSMQRCIPGLLSNVGQQHQQQQSPGYPNAPTIPLNQYRQHVPNNRTDTSDSLASINSPTGCGGWGAVPYYSYMTTGRHNKLPAKLPSLSQSRTAAATHWTTYFSLLFYRTPTTIPPRSTRPTHPNRPIHQPTHQPTFPNHPNHQKAYPPPTPTPSSPSPESPPVNSPTTSS